MANSLLSEQPVSAPAPIPTRVFDWNDPNRTKALEDYYVATIKDVSDQIDWYTRHLPGKKNWAQATRIAALLLLGLGSIFPVIIEVFKLTETISPVTTTLIIAAGTGLLALDRFMGYSSGWMRYLDAEMTLKARLEAFKGQWELDRLALEIDPPSRQDAIKLVQHCQAFRSEAAQLVHVETQHWMDEFRSNNRWLGQRFDSSSQGGSGGLFSDIPQPTDTSSDSTAADTTAANTASSNGNGSSTNGTTPNGTPMPHEEIPLPVTDG